MCMSTHGYAGNAAELIARYEAVNPADKHAAFQPWLPDSPRVVLDVGAGTGADAAWLAEQGHRVVAVEPLAEFRVAGQALHASARIEWVDDQLPTLESVLERDHLFDLVLLSAVWMHLDLHERDRAMSTLAALLAPGGVVCMTLRHGPVPQGRRMFEVTPQEVLESAQSQGLSLLMSATRDSLQPANRQMGVTWSHLVFCRST